MAELFRVEFSNPDGEIDLALVALQEEPRTVQEILTLCRTHGGARAAERPRHGRIPR